MTQLIPGELFAHAEPIRVYRVAPLQATVWWAGEHIADLEVRDDQTHVVSRGIPAYYADLYMRGAGLSPLALGQRLSDEARRKGRQSVPYRNRNRVARPTLP